MRPVRLDMAAFGPYASHQVVDFRELGDKSFFLIHGPTGSGKTSILDALTFALYGVTSGDERRAAEMRSDFAEAATETEVTFDFSLGSELYRVWRRPRQERAAQRGGGMVTVGGDAALWRITGSGPGEEGAVLASGLRDVDGAVARLLGFRSDQFRQVVVLPQGRFRELLSADVKAREDILRHLFRTERYGQIEAFLKTKRNDLKTDLVRAEAEALGVLRAVGVEDGEALENALAAAEKELAVAEQALAGSLTAETAAREALDRGRQADTALRELAAAEAAESALGAREPKVAGQRAELEAARRAGAVVEARARAEQDEAQTLRCREAVDAALRVLDEAAVEEASARQALDREGTRAPEREEAAQRVRMLDGMSDRVRAWEQAVAGVQVAAAAVGKATLAYEGACRLVQAADRAGDIAREVERLSPELQELRRRASERRRLDAADGDRGKAGDTLEQAVRAEDEAHGRLTAARAALSQAEKSWHVGQAGRLAETLADGAPCPVCGSVEHPAPAHLLTLAPDDDDLATAREEVERAQGRLTEAAAARAAAETATAAAEQRADELREALGLWSGRTAEELEADAGRLADRKADLEQERAGEFAARGPDGDPEACREAQERLRIALGDSSRQQAACEATLQACEAEVPPALRQSGALQAELDAARRREAKLSAGAEAADARMRRATEALAAARAGFDGATGTAAEAAARAAASAAVFQEALTQQGFSGRSAFDAAVRSPVEVQLLEDAVNTYERELAAARDRVGRARRLAEGTTPPDIAALEQAARVATQACDEAKAERARRQGDWQMLCQARDAHEQVLAETRQLHRRYTLVGRLAEVALGENIARLSFQRFVLAHFLDEVLAVAGSRLQHMSRGRYRLQRATGPVDGRRAGGLELEVFDEHTGCLRPVSTLSGGEGFLASLALALALAEVVQARAGGLHLETIFVDEGFGTLDPEALESAIDTLIELARTSLDGGSGRLVGVISHVPELVERIDARLEVIPGRTGSRARFVVA